MRVRLDVAEEDESPVAAAADRRRRAPRVAAEAQPGSNPKYTFDNFVIGSSNRFAHAAALAVAEWPAQAYNPLFVYGDTGLGKTHLLQAIGAYVSDHSKGMTTRYVTSETFTNDFINSLRDKRIEGFKHRYRAYDVLLVDDIQFLEGKERFQEEFFHTFNSLYEAGRQIVISSDRPPKEIATLEERLRSRFEWGLITDIQPPDLETRIAILRKKVTTDRIAVTDPEVLDVHRQPRLDEHPRARGCAHPGRRLLVAHRSRTSTARSPSRCSTISSPTAAACRCRPSPSIQEVVCESFALSVEELCSQRRSQAVAYPRQVAMYLSRELTDSSLPEDRQGVRRARPHHRAPRECEDHADDLRGQTCVQPGARPDRKDQAPWMNLPVMRSTTCVLGDRWTTASSGPTARSGMNARFPSVFPIVHTPYGLRRKV